MIFCNEKIKIPSYILLIQHVWPMLGILVKMHLYYILTSKNRLNILKEYTYRNYYESHGVVPHEGLHSEYVT